jgi:hypothetical protein
MHKTSCATGSVQQANVDRYRKKLGKEPLKRPKLKKVKPPPMIIERPNNTEEVEALYEYAAKFGFGVY